VPADLHDRAADNWRPLFAIADAAGGHWPETARSTALALSGGADGEGQSKAVLLLGDIRDVLGTSTFIASADLVSLLTRLDDRPWATWSRGFPITPAQIAKLLSGFEIRPRPIWVERPMGKTQVRGYARGDFTDAFTRYLATT
jgi:putative DNA primase/helicase